jgi:hypothetical protein
VNAREIDLEEVGDYIALDNPKRAVSYDDCSRLIRCLHAFQQHAITQAPRFVAYRLPKFVRALRGFLSLSVTKVHIK